ncbi:hypothetical protein [Arcobacter porcinus]|uniref:DNA repair protein Rad50 n=1 Tax=Arcobacter porcinus TaxID=1935204 RepID=A0A5C2HD54_9BACT|nr:hypothetical protein [Arcobacter porcinus]OCL85395.1 hypothetical protein AAX30_01895 [Arcobacter porcinus]OCL90721.1 hypothetical protein AAX27_01532 [Aliarcobacter thereius]QEP40876.1 hypothetical protein APORC_1281 [Arcobacter porcinus]
MINIKLELKNLIEKTMIPESKNFIEELDDLINNNKATKDDIEAKKEMLVFLSELETILSAISKNDITDKEAADIYEKIINMLEQAED